MKKLRFYICICLLILIPQHVAFGTSCKHYQDQVFEISLIPSEKLQNQEVSKQIFKFSKTVYLRTMGEDNIAIYNENGLVEGHVFQLKELYKPDNETAAKIDSIKKWKEDSFCGNRILNYLGIMPGGNMTITRIPLKPGLYIYSEQNWLGNPKESLRNIQVRISSDLKRMYIFIPSQKIKLNYIISNNSKFEF
ncbi:MAG: hypothetical protein ABUK01_02990 [Leptospirales bacterium]